MIMADHCSLLTSFSSCSLSRLGRSLGVNMCAFRCFASILAGNASNARKPSMLRCCVEIASQRCRNFAGNFSIKDMVQTMSRFQIGLYKQLLPERLVRWRSQDLNSYLPLVELKASQVYLNPSHSLS